MAIKPTKPTTPPKALRSDPATFPARAEGTVDFLFGDNLDYVDDSNTFVDDRADQALASAVAAAVGALDAAQRETFAGYLVGISTDPGNPLEAVEIVERPVLDGAAAISTASGSTKTQAIPAGVQEVIVVLDEVGVDTAQGILELQLGTSAALVTTGYESACLEGDATPVLRTSTSSISLGSPITAFASGTVTLTRAVAGGNHWDASFSGRFGTAQVLSGSGSITLAGELDLIGLVSTNFDNGQFYVRWR